MFLQGRRSAKYPLAENQTITWCREQRKKGNKLTTRIVRVKMAACVKNHYGPNTGFKASSGWMKRFMGRYGLTWRRRNDNAKIPVSSLVGACANFITKLRKFRLLHPKGTDTKFGAFGPYNTFNVDQVPLPFASSDPRTLEFIGCQRVWIKQPGSGLDKRQATLQCLIRPLGKQPKPTLLFRGNPVLKREVDKRARAKEEEGYDKDVIVLWQAKAWADNVTCVAWAERCFKPFVEEAEEIDDEDESLLLADSLRSQTKDTFSSAVKQHVNAHTIFGVKNGSHVWQPVDHHVGAAYHRKMDAFYVEWMASVEAESYKGTIPVGKRRQLLTQWAGRAYRELEEKRVEAEQARAEDPTKPPSMFYAAFLRTGCLVTADGTEDDEIRPHVEIVGDIKTQFEGGILPPDRINLQPEPEPEPFIVELAGSSEDEQDGDSDSEDRDDDPLENDEDDEEREPVPNDLELEVEDEQALMRAAAAAARESGAAELRDFNMARRVARQEGFTVQPSFEGAAPSDNSRRQQIYNEDLAAWEKEMNKKASARVQDIIWNTAEAKALEEKEQARGGDNDGNGEQRRISKRQRRRRVT
jgi:hypothetical protein